MNNLNILNSLNFLQKVSAGENNAILFYFGDTPKWSKNTLIDTRDPQNFYEVIEVNVEGNFQEVYWKIHRYTGEQMFLQLDNEEINVWEGEISEYEERWSTFDDFDQFKHFGYKTYRLEKTAEDWKSDYEKLRKNYHALHNKKWIQVKEFRASLQKEMKGRIESRIQHLINAGHTVDYRTLNEVYAALNDEKNGIHTSSITDFIFE